MTTGKRQIPINNHGTDSARAGDPEAVRNATVTSTPGVNAPAGGAAAQGASAHGTSAHAAGGSAKATSGGAHGRHDRSAPSAVIAAELDSLIADREALVVEREALVAERDALTAQVDALNDSRLRLQAEFENFRKRAAREAVESHGRTQCEVLNDFLPILDNLERALDAAEHHEEGKVLAGVRMTRDMFATLLARAGVEEIEGAGAPFDPAVHDAMAVQPSEYEEGTVAAVLERGYRQGERVLRPARVVVSAGGTTAATGAAGSAGGTGAD